LDTLKVNLCLKQCILQYDVQHKDFKIQGYTLQQLQQAMK